MLQKLKKVLKPILFPFLAILLSLFVSVFFVMWAKGYSITQYFTAVSDLMGTIWKGSFGTKRNMMNTIAEMSPLIFAGVANAVAFRTGLFNIGVAGQFAMGMISAGIIGTIPGLNPVVHVILIALGGILAGTIWGGIPGFLRARFGTSEVINTIMLNYISMFLANYIILKTRFGVPGKARTPIIEKSAQLTRFMPSAPANISIFIAIAVAIFIFWLLWKTTIGYEIRAVGINPHAAEYGGISVAKNAILAMVISGAIAGLGGALHVAGVNHMVQDFMAVPNYGFDGIAVALLAKNNPIGCIASAVLFAALNTSARALQLNGIPKEIVFLIQAIIIIFVATDYIMKYFEEKKKKGAIING